MFILEYAQYQNRRFIGWMESDMDFESRADAVEFARTRGLEIEGEDFLVTEAFATRRPDDVLVLAASW